MKHKIFTLAISLLASFSAFNAQALTLDNFEGAQSIDASSSAPSISSTLQFSGLVGGSRTIYARYASGPSKIACEVIDGFLSLSEDAKTNGSALIVWDAGSAAAAFNPVGLGGIDLTQDQSDAFSLKIDSFDYPSEKASQILIKIFDATDPTGSLVSQATVNLLQQYDGSESAVSIPYASFAPIGSKGGASFRDVGAITLEIDGTNAADVTLDFFNTNGSCGLVPGVTPVVDVCNVCGGDGKSCLDCTGTPFGKSVLDSCGVCGGDGKSCACKVVSQSFPTGSVIKTAKVLLSRTLKFTKSAQLCTHKVDNTYVTSSNKLYATIDALIESTYPSSTLSCANALCVKTSQATAIVSLKKIGKQLGAVAKNAKIHAGKVCPSHIEGPVSVGVKVSDDYTNDLLNAIKKLPASRTQCS